MCSNGLWTMCAIFKLKNLVTMSKSGSLYQKKKKNKFTTIKISKKHSDKKKLNNNLYSLEIQMN